MWVPPTVDLLGYAIFAAFIGVVAFVLVLGALDYSSRRRRR